MAMYGDQVGLRLLRTLAQERGQIITAEDAVAAGSDQGASPAHVYKVLSEMAGSGLIRRLKGGLYAIEAPLGGRGAPHDFAIATHLARPSAISHWSALHHWGLMDQVPLRTVTASTTQRVPSPPGSPGHAGWIIDGITYRFVRVPEQHMFGIVDVWVDSETRVPFFDRERTVLDAFVQTRDFGRGHVGEMLMATHHDDLDLDRLAHYAEKLGRAVVVKRVRHALSKTGARELSEAVAD